ncbi:MAG TPA: pitrilysin family protein [Bryobacteraceae bacterium]|nr:pitrilysin family protein [Bryobacteraceae bacterium]
MLKRIALAASLLVFVAAAQTLPPGVTKGPSMAGITEYAFPNGLRVLLLPDSSSTKVSVNMVYLVGSRHEGYGESGMAHLLEHMNFILSKDGRNIKKELTDHGAAWNGTTDVDRTNYFETVSASDENLKWALGLEATRMVNMRIEKPLLDTEMTVVRNEFESGENNPVRILDERVSSTAYLWHNYGKSTIGSLADIERVPIDRLEAFYKKYYQPDNAVLIVGGQIDPAKTLQMAMESVGAIPRPARKLDETYTVEPPQDGERTVELRRVGSGKNFIMAYHGPSMANPDSAVLEVASGIMEGPNGTGRLYKALVDNKKAMSASMSASEPHDPGLIEFSARLSNDQDLDEVKKTMLQTIAGLVNEPPTKEEVDRAKERIIQRMDREFSNTQSMAVDVLTEVVADGDWRLLYTNYAEIKSVTPEDIVRVAKLYLKDSNRTVGVFIPDTAPDRTVVPEAPSMDKLLSEYKPNVKVQEGEVLDPAPAAVEKRIIRTQLPGSIHLALLPKATRGDLVDLNLTLRFGDEKSLNGKYAAAEMAGALLMRGTGTMNRQQIADAIQKLNATINVGRGGGRGAGGALAAVSGSIRTMSENLIPAMRLMAQILKDPAFPEADFDQIRQQLITSIERGRTEPNVLASQALQANISPFPRSDVRHPRSIDEQIEDLKKLTLDDVKAFYKEFYGASNGYLVAVGAMKTDEVQKAAAELFGNWKSSASYARIDSKYLPVTPVDQKIETPDKENAYFYAAWRLQMHDTDPDYAAMVLANYMMGGEISSRWPNRIRNQEGLSYGASSSFTAPFDGDAAVLSVGVISNPKNSPKVEASFRDELKKTLADGFTQQELDGAKKAFRDARVLARSGDTNILSLILTRSDQDRTLDWDIQMDAKLAALTLDQVNAAFRKHITDAVSVVQAGDFRKAGVYQ